MHLQSQKRRKQYDSFLRLGIMPQGPCPSCQEVFEFPVGFAEVYECPYCGANVVVPRKLVLNANLSSQQILIQGIICFIFATLLFFVPFMIFGSTPQSDLDWYIFFIICSWPTYILLAMSIYFFFKSRHYLKHEEML